MVFQTGRDLIEMGVRYPDKGKQKADYSLSGISNLMFSSQIATRSMQSLIFMFLNQTTSSSFFVVKMSDINDIRPIIELKPY